MTSGTNGVASPGLQRLLALAAATLAALAMTHGWRVGPLHPSNFALAALGILWLAAFGKDARLRRPLLPFAAVAFAALAALALTAAPDLQPALLAYAKSAVLLLAGVFLFANVSSFGARAIAGGIAVAAVANVAVAVVQYLTRKEPVAVAGLLESRTLYGACVALGAPLVLLSCRRLFRSAAVAAAAAGIFVFAGAMTILSLPMLLIFGAAGLAAALNLGRPFVRSAAIALIVAGMLVAQRNSGPLLESVSAFDRDGNVRRVVVEAAASAHAAADRPLLGHGPGTYQSVVSSGQYRGALPAPAENRVELATEPGYAVAAVETGALSAIALALLFAFSAAGAMRSARAAKSEDDAALAQAAAISVCAAGVASAFTVLLINGPVFLVGAVVGLATTPSVSPPYQGGENNGTPSVSPLASWLPILRRIAPVLACLLAALVLRMGGVNRVVLSDYGEIAAADLAGAGRQTIVIEAEESSIVVAPMRKATRRDASAGSCIGVDEGAGKPPKVEGSATYAVQVPAHGRYRLWVRAWWSDGCANSIAAALDGQPPALLGNDGNYARWHWVPGPVTELVSGTHVLTLRHREDNLEIDQILLSNDDGFLPEGALATARRPAPVAPQPEPVAPKPEPKPAPVVQPDPKPVVEPEPIVVQRVTPEPAPVVGPTSLPVAVVPPEGKSFLVGIGGCYRDGFEGHLVSLGISYRRLRDDELGNIELLKDIDVLMASDPRCDCGAFYRTLYAFLNSGRTAIIEVPPQQYSGENDPDNLLFQRRGAGPMLNVTVLADDSIYFKGAPRRNAYSDDVRCYWLPTSTTIPGAAIFGGMAAWGGAKTSGALLVRSVGKGKLYFASAIPAYNAMWRGRKLDPFCVNIFRDAIGNNCGYPFANLQFAPAQRAVDVSDDFMRSPGQSGGWKKLEGVFGLTGENRDSNTMFSVNGLGTAFAAVGNEKWKDYSTAASVLLKSGAAGVWQTTVAGGRLTLRLRDGGKSVALTDRSDAGDKVLAEAAVPECPGWRRLALFRRDGRTCGFVDGVCVVSVPDAPETAGRCGLCVIDGDACFDDFRAVDTAALTPGRDVAPGDEGSERCMVRYFQRCSEKLSVYSPQWMLSPSPVDPDYLQLRLPLFKGGVFRIDEQAPVVLAPGEDLPFMRLNGKQPSSIVAVHTPFWRDYHFAGRVTDWYSTGGEWMLVNRWSCDPEYQWYGGGSRNDTALWYKHAVAGPVAIEALLAPRADRRYGQECGRDLNLVVFGNGKDLSDGYLFTVLEAGRGCQVSRGGKVLGRNAVAGLPSGHALHHPWFSVAAIVAGKKISFYFDRRLAVECVDDEPLDRGRIGVWTRNNRISLARATLSLSSEPDAKK